MSYYSKHDPSGQWSRLIDRQREQQQIQEKQEKDEQENRKKLYREELERLINEQKQSNLAKTKFDTEFNGAMQKFMNERDVADYQKQKELKDKQAEFVRYSLEQEQLKKQQQQINFIQERQKQYQIGVMMEQAEKQENLNKLMKKEELQKNLAQSYQAQEEQKRLESQMQKQRDHLLMQQSYERSKQEEQQRQQQLGKIKYGYHQNAEVLQKYNDIYLQKEIQQREIQRKLIDEAAYQKQKQEEEKFMIEKVTKDKIKKDTYDTILNQINVKQQNIREEQSLKYRDQEALNNLQQRIQYQDKQKSERKNQIQRQYRQDLIMQIEEDKNRKYQEASMSMVELNMNKKIFEADENNVGIGVVPGLSNHIDYQKLMQRAYVDGTLRKSADQQINFRRNRNVSAYIAGNNITANYGY